MVLAVAQPLAQHGREFGVAACRGDRVEQQRGPVVPARQFATEVFEQSAGFACTGLPRVTLSRGKVAWADGDLRAQAGDGQYVPRDPFPAVHTALTTWRELTAPRPVQRGEVTP